MPTPDFYLAAALTVVGGIAWALRLEGRVNKNEALHAELKEHVQYIRDRIDQALSGE
jgi:hypothetical protein